MSRPKNKRASKRRASPSENSKRKHRTQDRVERAIDQPRDESAKQERYAWLQRPRLHTAIFEQARLDDEIEKFLASENIIIRNSEIVARKREKQRQDIQEQLGNLHWPQERLELFKQHVAVYRRDPSIRNYLQVRQEFPEVDIQIADYGGIEAAFNLEKEFQRQGIDPHLVAAALDANEPSVDALCLRLLELLAARDNIPKSGPGHIENRRHAISDATVNYLVATILAGFDWDDHMVRVPGSLVVLIKHQLCRSLPDLEAEVRLRQKKADVALLIAELINPDERLSINKLKELGGLKRSTAARWLADPTFQSWLDAGRKWAADGLFKRGRRAADKRRT